MTRLFKNWVKGPTKAQAAYGVDDLDRVIQDYEVDRGMSSASFKSLWDAGELDHGDFELSRWALLLGARARAAGSLGTPPAAS